MVLGGEICVMWRKGKTKRAKRGDGISMSCNNDCYESHVGLMTVV